MDRLALIILVLGMLGMSAITRACDYLARRQTLEAEAQRRRQIDRDLKAIRPRAA